MFGLIAGLLFAYDAYTIFLQLKSSRQHTAAATGGNPPLMAPPSSLVHSFASHLFLSLQTTEFKGGSRRTWKESWESSVARRTL